MRRSYFEGEDLRTGNLGSLSERDWAAIRERKAFEQEESERIRLAEDQEQFQAFRNGLDSAEERVPPAYRLNLTFEEWRSHVDPSIADPVVRGAAATNAALLSKSRRDEAATAEKEREEARKAILAGNPDPGWTTPASAVGLKMTVEQGRAYASEQGRLFVDHNPEYYPCSNNLNNLREYLIAQNISIPTEEAFKLAWLRLRELDW